MVLVADGLGVAEVLVAGRYAMVLMGALGRWEPILPEPSLGSRASRGWPVLPFSIPDVSPCKRLAESYFASQFWRVTEFLTKRTK